MKNDEFARDRRKQKRLERLGTNDPRCGMCGEADDRALELHHVAGRRQDDTMVILCRNCHRKVTDDQKDHPEFNKGSEPMLSSIGHFLLGLADMLRIIVDKLYEFGRALIAAANEAPEGGQ
jgi:hypothetical protein